MKTLEFAALVLVAIILVPSGSHLFALPNKIGLDQAPYFVAQSIYRGWALFGAAIIPALAVTAALAFARRGEGAPFWFALAAMAGIVANLAIFFTWTYPANVATADWTTVPANWSVLRMQWEYSHAANAIVTFGAFCCIALSVLSAHR